MTKPKIVTVCGSSRFIDLIAATTWIIERNELSVVLGMTLLPWWYAGKEGPKDHMAEFEDCAKEMDALHLHKISMSDEIFVVDALVGKHPYVGRSTSIEIAHALKTDKKVRFFSKEEWIRKEVYGRLQTSLDKLEDRP